MRRLLLACLFVPLLSFAKTDGVEVRLTSAKGVDVEPGKVVSASFVVTNHSDQNDDFTEELIVPEGWTKIAPVGLPFELPAGGSAVRLVAFAVPPDAPADRREIRYVVRGRLNPGFIDGDTFSVVVLPVSKLELALEEKPELVIAGDEFAVKYRVTNRGNARVVLGTEIKSVPDFAVTGAPGSIALDPSATRDILLKVNTDDVTSRLTYALVFKATSGKDERTLSRTAVVEVMPRISGDRDPFIRVPARLRLMMGQETDRDPLVQLELSGAGAIDEEGKRRVEFLFRGPDTDEGSLLGERDEYRVSYFGEQFDFHIGDRTYALSPLTERYGYGRGAEVHWHQGSWGAGLFYMKSRWRTPEQSELGAYARHDFSKSFNVQANFLRKWSDDHTARGAFPQNIYSLGTRWRPGKYLDAGFEFGVADSDRGLATGFHLSARGEIGRLNYAIEKTRAEPQFRGSYSDSDSTHASLNFPITKKLRATVSFHDYTGSLERNPERSTVVTKERAFRGGARYTLPSRTELSLEYQDVQRKDVLDPAAFDFHERSLRLGARQGFGRLSVQSFIDAGVLDNELADAHGVSFQRYSLYATYTPTARQSYTIYGSYGPSSFTGTLDRELSMGASAALQLRDNLSVNAQYSRNTFDSLRGGTHDIAQAQLTYTLENTSSVSVLGRWSSNSRADKPEAAVWVTYSVPLSLPFGKKKSVGQLRGRVMLGEGFAARPLPRAILLANEFSAVSDSTGEYTFPALKPGQYTVRVEPTSIGLERVTARPFPVLLEVRKGQSATLDVHVLKAASMAVRVALFTAPARTRLGEEPVPQERGGFEGGLVELTNGSEIVRQQTDRHGVANFSHLRPGRWRVKLEGTNIPAHHRIEEGVRELELKPGENGPVAMRVVSQTRTINFVDEGTIQ